MTIMIDYQGVTKRFGDNIALNNITLQAITGEIIGLLGSSGCGKTTTLRLLAGLERPDEGRICINGQTMSDQQTWVEPENRQIGMVFQDYALFPHLTIEANIAFPLHKMSRQERRYRVQELLELVRLLEDDPLLAKRYPHEVSGGQQQRVALARALAPQPNVILLDEPFSNLDAELRKSTREDVRRILKSTNTTALFVTHDQEEALSISDRVAMLRRGELLQVGTPQEIYWRPNDRRVAKFIGEANFINGEANGSRVDTVLGNLPLAEPANGAVEVMIRPERIELVPDSTGEYIATQVQFLGYDQLTTILLPNGETVNSRTRARIDLHDDTKVNLTVLGRVRAYPQT